MGQLRLAVGLIRSRLRTQRATSAMLFAIVLITSVLAASMPVLVQRVADAGLRHAVDSARNLEFVGQAHFGSAGDPLAFGRTIEQGLPAALRGAIGERQLVIDTPRYLAVRPPRPVTHVQLRYQSGIDEHVRLVEGRPPTAALAIRQVDDGSTEPLRVTSHEVALSRATAETLLLGVGDELLLTDGGGYIGIDIVGVYEVIDPDADYWLDDTALHQPNVAAATLDQAIHHATALVAAHPTRGEDIVMRLRFRLDPQRLDAAGLAQVEADLRRLETRFPVRALAGTIEAPSLHSSLSRAFDDYRRQRSLTEAALLVAAMGPLTAVAGALALAIHLGVRRRAGPLLYLRWRGGSGGQLLVAALLEGALIAVPAAGLGLLVVLGLGGTSTAGASLASVALVVTATIGLLAAVTLPVLRAPLGSRLPEQSVDLPVRLRRLVLESLFVGFAALVVVGLADRRPLVDGRVDALLIAAPLLAGMAVGVVLLRLLPLALRGLGAIARRRPGLLAVHALRSAAGHAGAQRLPLLVALLIAAFGVFTSSTLVSLERAQQAASWQRIGADYRLVARSGDVIPPELDLSTVPGVRASTASFLIDAYARGGVWRRQQVVLQAVAPPGYEAVLASSPVQWRLPSEFDGLWIEGRTGSEQPLPAVVSAALARSAAIGVGDELEVTLPGGRARLTVIEVREDIVGLPAGSPSVLVPQAGLQAAVAGRVLRPTVVLAAGSAEAEPALRQAIEPFARRLRLTSRHELFARTHQAPLAAAVTGGLYLAFALAVAYSVIALAVATSLSIAARQRELALLRTLGLGRAELLRLLLLEHVPGMLVALLGGALLGAGLARLLLPALGLEVFAGEGGAVRPQFDEVHVSLTLLLPGVVLLLVVLAGAWAARRGCRRPAG